MPLVDIYLKPGYELEKLDGTPRRDSTKLTRWVIRKEFAFAIPRILIDVEKLGISWNAVQVMNHGFEYDDVNVPSIWVKIQFREEPPGLDERRRISSRIHSGVIDWFNSNGWIVDDHIVVEVLWGPTSGKGVVSGVKIAW